jgi:hypothetical protein
MTPSEELRRQLSVLVSRRDEGRRFTKDELQEVWQTMKVAERLNEQRAMGVCLEIVREEVDRVEEEGIDVDDILLEKVIRGRQGDATSL